MSANYKIILMSTGKNLVCGLQDLVCILASTFNIETKEVSAVIKKAPIILFDNLSIADINRLQNTVVFLSKMGIDLLISLENRGWKSTNWTFSSTPPIAACPSCGDTFFLLNSNSFLKHQKLAEDNKISQHEDDVSADFEEIDGFSAELESIVDMDDSSVEEIEEIGSVSQELEEMGSFSEELEKIGDLAEELEELSRSDGFVQNNISQIEDIEGISAEFEDIEGVSAEFERICMEDMDEIGSLSAELEEIEGISAEFEKISDDDLEKLDEASFNNFDLRGVNKSEEKKIKNIPAPKKIPIVKAPVKKIPVKKQENVTSLSQNQKVPPKSSLVIQPGVYNVVININAQGNIKLANKTISKLLQIPFEKVVVLTQQHPAITVVRKVSKETAQTILQQFQKYKMSGHITISK